MKKLTNEILDQRLTNKNIIRLDNYINKRTPINFKCKICGHEWESTPATIKNVLGCDKCHQTKRKLDNAKDVVQKLAVKNIKQLNNYIDTRTKIKLHCLTCNHKWDAYPNNVVNGTFGCPECAGNIKLTDLKVDNRLIGTNIIRIDKYINIKTPITFKCESCGHKWKTYPNNILNKGTGCKMCNKIGKNELLILNILKNNNINFIHQFNIKNINNLTNNYRIDFYFPNQKLAIEYNGRQHYEPCKFFGELSVKEAEIAFQKQQLRDQYVQNFADSHNIKLIWIDGRKYKGINLENYFKQETLPLLKII